MRRRGIVKEVDADKLLVRCTWPDDGIDSPWLRVVVRDSVQDKDVWLPSEGAQVECMLDEREEDGVVLGAIYDDEHVPPEGDATTQRVIAFRDGCVVRYDTSSHVLDVLLPSGGKFRVADGDSPFALAPPIKSDLEKIRSDIAAIQTTLGTGANAAGAVVFATPFVASFTSVTDPSSESMEGS